MFHIISFQGTSTRVMTSIRKPQYLMPYTLIPASHGNDWQTTCKYVGAVKKLKR